MGAHWSTLSADDLAAVVRQLGVAFEPYAVFLQENGIDGATLAALAADDVDDTAVLLSSKEGFNNAFAVVAEKVTVLPGQMKAHKLRLLLEVRKSERLHPLPKQPDEAVVAEAQTRSTQLADQATITAAANTVTPTTATAPGSCHNNVTAVQLRQMPEILRAFRPLVETLFISALAAVPELKDAETAFVNPQQSSVEVRAAAAVTINKMVQRLTDAMHHEVKFRFSQPGAAGVLQAVVKAGRNDFKKIYSSVWDTVCNDESGIDSYKVAVASAIAAAQPHSDKRQSAQSIAELVQQAGQCKSQFEGTVKDIVSRCRAEIATGDEGVGDFPQARVPATLKKVSRIVEKLLLHPTGPITDVGRIFDVVRGMIRCQTMNQIAIVLDKLTAHPNITIVRVKDRFIANPSPGGWRDCQVCFFLNGSDNNSNNNQHQHQHRHICELQIVHEDVYNRRAQLPGHVVYGRVRNADEMLEALLAGGGYWYTGGVLERLRLGPIPTGIDTQIQKVLLCLLYNATNGSSWTKSSEWGNLNGSIGDWYGVEADKAGNVLSLALQGNNLSGKSLIIICLPTNSTSHTVLWLCVGTIPEELGHFVCLQVLKLTDNKQLRGRWCLTRYLTCWWSGGT